MQCGISYNMDSITVFLPNDFPLKEIQTIIENLRDKTNFVTGYVSPDCGFMNFESLILSSRHETILSSRHETILILDRNIVTRMCSLARDGVNNNDDLINSAEIMALAQVFDFLIDPSISYHELAHCEGNDTAIEELFWFRHADHNQARDWINIALGKQISLPVNSHGIRENHNFAFPLTRWRRNYAAVLKIAEIELSIMPDIEKAKRFICWLINDYFVAGPAMIFAMIYFSPNKLGQLIKSLRANDRCEAIKGVKNAAWDLTYLSEFVKKVNESSFEKQRYIFVTNDKVLSKLAEYLIIDAEDINEVELKYRKILSNRWKKKDAGIIAKLMCEAITAGKSREAPDNTFGHEDYIGHLIEQGEKLILDWGV